MSLELDSMHDEIDRLREENARLREALQRCPQYIVCAHYDGKRAGLDESTLKLAQRDLDFVNAVLEEVS